MEYVINKNPFSDHGQWRWVLKVPESNDGSTRRGDNVNRAADKSDRNHSIRGGS